MGSRRIFMYRYLVKKEYRPMVFFADKKRDADKLMDRFVKTIRLRFDVNEVTLTGQKDLKSGMGYNAMLFISETDLLNRQIEKLMEFDRKYREKEEEQTNDDN